MYDFKKLVCYILVLFFFLTTVFFLPVSGCKVIVAVNDATAGNYSLLLKVRDPSRLGLQVLCIVPAGYEYTYHHPWTEKPLDFTVRHKFIGVATKEDTLPNIVKAGMALSDTGIAYGDADTGSNWKNPSCHAWDDFDWIRYACQDADSEEEAVSLMTTDLVDKMHASAVSENLFIVGPYKAFVIEADAFHYTVNEINDILVMHNYPKELWQTQYLQKMPIARTFDTEVEKSIRKGGVIRLQSLYGVKLIDIGENWIVAAPVYPLVHAALSRFLNLTVKIYLGERKTVGHYSITLLGIEQNKAKISMCTKFKAWEQKMLQIIQSQYGFITVRDMINWSRLHSEDLDGLRPMCEDKYEFEAVAIYKIPTQYYETMSIGWFAANHACSSIFVPFHICDNDIFNPYKTDDAAKQALSLLNLYGHNQLLTVFNGIENVFLNENKVIETKGIKLLKDNRDIAELFTISDTTMQQQAFLTQQLWVDLNDIQNEQQYERQETLLENIWESNYTKTLKNCKESYVNNIMERGLREKILEIALSISSSRIEIAKCIDENFTLAEEEYQSAQIHLEEENYEACFNHLEKALAFSNMIINDLAPSTQDVELNNSERIKNVLLIVALAFCICISIVIFIILIKKKMKQY